MNEFGRTDTEFQRQFRAIEPDFDFLASYGERIIPALVELLSGKDELLAIRAVYVAGQLERSVGLPILVRAANDPRAPVRVAVAGALRLLHEENEKGERRDREQEILLLLLTDNDSSVRRWAAKTAGTLGMASLKDALAETEKSDGDAAVRSAALGALKKLDKSSSDR